MEPRRAGAGVRGPFPQRVGSRKQEVSCVRSFQEGHADRRLEVSRRILPQGWRGQEVVLVVGHPLGMLMPVNQGLREAGPLRAVVPGRISRMPMIPQSMRSQPEPLRQGGSGKEEESGGERLAERHARIVTHRSVAVKRSTAAPECAAAP